MSARDDSLNVRVDSNSKRQFIEKCRETGQEYPDVVRELLVAYADGRVTIQPTDEQLKRERIYQR